MEDNTTGVNEPMVPYERPLDFQQVWQMFQETDRILTERFQEIEGVFTKVPRYEDLWRHGILHSRW